MRSPRTPIPPARWLVSLLVLGSAAASVLAGCSHNSSPAAPLPPNSVKVADFAFAPETITVHVGDTVTWVFDQPDAPHNVVALTTPVLFNSGTPQGRGAFHFQFTQPGTFTYICQVHPNMRGTVVVTP